MNDLAVSYKVGERDLTITADDVRQYFCPQATIKEIKLFLELCAAKHMDPYLRDAYLIKYGDKPATIVTGKDYFVKVAQAHHDFDGFEAGLVLMDAQGNVHTREGSNALPGMQILGGYARAWKKNCSHAFFEEVSFSEYAGTKYDKRTGQMVLNNQWATKPGTMIRKVALCHVLREAYPDLFGGLYDSVEMAVEVDDKPVLAEEAAAEYEAPIDSDGAPQQEQEYEIYSTF